MHTINFLQASTPLTKSYTKTAGTITKTPYPFVWEFTSVEEQFSSLTQLEELLKKHAALGHCALKGTIAKPLVKESRAGSTDTSAPTSWLVLDLDGLPDVIEIDGGKPEPLTIDVFLNEMGLGDTSYVVQWSASYGVENNKLRAHVFMLLDKPHAAPLIKQWLIQKNLTVPLLSDSLGLTKTGNALSWALDISACQNDKLIYIAPPVLKGIKDPMANKPRIECIKRKYDTVSLGTVQTTAKNKAAMHKVLDQLREEAGLPVRKAKYKMVGAQEVMLQPDESVITDTKTERGFVYFNLNGGDSWAYYHPENKPDYILNFKGEPAYLTKELLPEYWSQLTGAGSATRTSSSGITYLAFCDRATSAYWRGTYNAGTDELDLNIARNETQVRHFAKQHGVPMSDFVPEWDLVFDPHDLVRVDVENRIVNKFQPTQFMLNVADRAPKKPPHTIMRVLSHALGGDKAVIDHFMNWLAVIVQHRTRTLTAWVLHGRPGTGKGLLTNNILRPLFGVHTAVRNMTELAEKYNHYIDTAFLVFVDEVQTKALQNEAGVMAKLKNWITEPTVSIRAMYSGSAEVPNYSNWIFMSNKPDPVQIDKEDRRYNVGKYQNDRLLITPEEIEKIESELQGFYDYLANMPADVNQAAQVIHTVDRENMISATENSAESVANALLAGDFQFFLDLLPTDDSYKRNAQTNNRVEDYREVLKRLQSRTDPLNGKCNLAREELRALFAYTHGTVPDSPSKFTSYLKHCRVHIAPVWVDNKTVRGIQVQWKDLKALAEVV